MRSAERKNRNGSAGKAFQLFATGCSQWLGTKWSFAGAILLIGVWLVMGPRYRYSDTWQLVINTATTIVTFIMVFLIQNTQNRDARAIHLKLDEIIRAIHPARNEMIDIEKLSDDELDDLSRKFALIRSECERRAHLPEHQGQSE